MKNIYKFLSLLIAFSAFISCEENSDTLTGNEVVGGLIDVKSPLVAYVLNNGNTFEYEANFSVFQGEVKTTQVDVFKSFTNKAGKSSNEVLLKTITVPSAPQKQDIKFTATYNELIAGLILDGTPLPTSDSTLKIGEFWTLKYVSKTSEGKTHENAQKTKVGIGTRFAGKYKVIASTYWRIGVLTTSNWVGAERIVESVDATTYRFVGFAGPFAAATNTHYFTIDNSDNVKTPSIYSGSAQLLNGFGIINCFESPTDIVNACGVAGPKNVVVRDNISGKDKIYRTYGYLTTTGTTGPREFYEVIEKVIE